MFGIRQILLILGVILLFRLIGKVMSARRNINDQEGVKKSNFNKEKAKKNYGKVSINKINKEKLKDSDFTKYEEVE